MKESRFPPGWDQERVRRVLAHYEQQTHEDAVGPNINRLTSVCRERWGRETLTTPCNSRRIAAINGVSPT